MANTTHHKDPAADGARAARADNAAANAPEYLDLFVTKERMAHRLAIECRALALDAGMAPVAFVISEQQGSWRMFAAENQGEADAEGMVQRKAGPGYVNVYGTGEVLYFIDNPGEFTDAEGLDLADRGAAWAARNYK